MEQQEGGEESETARVKREGENKHSSLKVQVSTNKQTDEQTVVLLEITEE